MSSKSARTYWKDGRLNTAERPVVIKAGVFDHRTENHTTVNVARAIISSFNKAPRIFMAESDNYKGKGSERLQIWKELFSQRVVPFNLSDDKDTRKIDIAGEEMNLSHILFKPNIFVSTHILRTFDKGSILKNLFGLIPDPKKAKFHKKLNTVLLDIYEAIGGIDLAVLDGTYLYRGTGAKDRALMNTILVGRDAIAVEAVGATLAGLDLEKLPIIQEAVRRGLGEGNLEKIQIVGSPFEETKKKFSSVVKTLNRK